VKTSILAKATLTLALLSVMSTAGIKYVAVVESDIDEGSGASEKISRADVRLVTAELRREAVNNLPPKRYVIMTAETVMAQGGAVLEECADENCVITLGSKIGADYIVRGTVSKLESKFTLQVEMYETENGNLVASCDPVRAEGIGELVEKAAAACANMYKAWLATQNAPDDASGGAKRVSDVSVGGGGFFTGGFGGGIKWADGSAVAMPYTAGAGGYLFLDAVYAQAFAGYSAGGGKWISAASPGEDYLPYMSRTYINIGLLAKYPLGAGRLRYFPLLGAEYEMAIAGKLEFGDGSEYVFDGNGDRYEAGALSNLWVKLGGGADFKISENLYLRGELLYGVKLANDLESDGGDKFSDMLPSGKGSPMMGSGVSVRIGAGVHF
jgi:hypothetical protein